MQNRLIREDFDELEGFYFLVIEKIQKCFILSVKAQLLSIF